MPDATTTNGYLELLQHAQRKRWCTKVFCTTCGARDYRDALKNYGRQKLTNDLIDFDLGTLEQFPMREFLQWDGAIQLALNELRTADLAVPSLDPVLEAWLPKLGQHIRVNFVTRRLPGNIQSL